MQSGVTRASAAPTWLTARRGNKGGIGHHQLCLAVIDDVFDLGRCEAPVDRHANRADLVGSKHQHGAFGGLLGQAGDAVACADAKALQALCDPVRGLIYLRESPGAIRRPVGEIAAALAGVAPDGIEDSLGHVIRLRPPIR